MAFAAAGGCAKGARGQGLSLLHVGDDLSLAPGLYFSRIEDLDAALPAAYFVREPLPWPAAFLAARAFLSYRRRGGSRPTPLPDFFIGAHAAVAGYTLLTRVRRRYKTYFPKLDLIEP